MEGRFKPGDILLHFKRFDMSKSDRAEHPLKHMYRFIGYGIHTETNEELAFYEPLDPSVKKEFGVFARPKEQFEGLVDETKYPDHMGEYRIYKVVD